MDFETVLNGNYRELTNFIEGQFYDEIFTELKRKLNQIYSVLDYYEIDLGYRLTDELIDYIDYEGKNDLKRVVSRYAEYFNDSVKELHKSVLNVLDTERDKENIKSKINGLLDVFSSDFNRLFINIYEFEFDFIEELKSMITRRLRETNEDIEYEVRSRLNSKNDQLNEILFYGMKSLVEKVRSKEADFFSAIIFKIKDKQNDLELFGEVSWVKRKNDVISFDGKYLFEFKASNNLLQFYIEYLQKTMTIFDATSYSNEQVFSNDFRTEFDNALNDCIDVAINNNCFQDLLAFMEKVSKIGSLGKDMNDFIHKNYESLCNSLNETNQSIEDKDEQSLETMVDSISSDNSSEESIVEEVSISEQSTKKQEALDTKEETINEEDAKSDLIDEPKVESVTIPTQRLKVNIKGKLSEYGLKKDPNNKGFYIPTDFDGEEQKHHRGR